MKIGIMGDPHLDMVKFRRSEGFINKMTIMNNRAFEEALSILADKSDRVIIVGDLFDGSEITTYTNLFVNSALKRYKDKLPISIISGNHDYSQRSELNDYHVFDIIHRDENDLLNLYNKGVEFEQFEDEKIIIAFVPYKALGKNKNESFEKIYREVYKLDDYFKILVFHGTIDYDDDQFNDEYDMPTEIADLFDFIAAGHVHYPKLLQVPRNKLVGGKLLSNDVFHLTPGALMPSSKANQNTQPPAVYIFDTEKGQMEIINLEESPIVFEYNNIENINDVLDEISQAKKLGIYSIRYNGKMSDIDDLKYMKALENSLNIAIQAEDFSYEADIKKVKGFWDFIKESYPEYENDFREVVSE